MKRLVATVSAAALAVGVGVVMPTPASAEEYNVTEVSFGPPTITFTKTNPQYVNPRVGDLLTFTYPLPDPPAGSVMLGTEVRTWYGIATSEESCRENIGYVPDGWPRMFKEEAEYKLLGNRGLDPASDVDSLTVTIPIEQIWVGGFPCAITQINWQSGDRGSGYVPHEQYSFPTVGRQIQPLVEAIPVEPRQPYLLDPEKAVAGGGVIAVGLLFGDLINSPQISQRRLGFSLMSVARDKCDTTRAVYRPGEGVESIYGSFAIPSDAGGKYLCIFQDATVGGEKMTSLPRYYQIARGQVTLPSTPAISLPTALGRLRQAAANLQQAQSQPNVDQAALAQAVAEAEAARREVEAAAVRAQQANNAGQNNAGQNNAGATPAEIAAAQAEVEAVAAQVTTALGETSVGAGTASRSLAGLVRATGFDPLATPILAANAKNASGVSINVEAPAQAKQRTRIFTKLRVNEPVTRGGMRQYFLSLDSGAPRLLLKRTGFVPKGEKNKRFWMSRNFPAGTYGLLTTFQPSTPGMEGVATYQTIEVLDNPKKKKKKNRN